jgi:hypothetical protein
MTTPDRLAKRLDDQAMQAARRCFGDAIGWGVEPADALASAITEYVALATPVPGAVSNAMVVAAHAAYFDEDTPSEVEAACMRGAIEAALEAAVQSPPIVGVRALVAFLNEAAGYFERRDTQGEDMAFWANVSNAENCRKAAVALSSLAEAVATEPVATRELIEKLWGALNFILAFYEPGQRHLDTEAWKHAEAGGRRAHKAAREWLDNPPAPTGDSGALREALEPFAKAIEPDATCISGWRYGVIPATDDYIRAYTVFSKGEPGK